MDRAIFTAATGMTAAKVRQQVIASNMANTNTIGFRAETVQGEAIGLRGTGLDARAMNQTLVHRANMASGTLIETGQALDIAVTGDAMIALQAADGSEAYSRRGDLSVDPSGMLINGDGALVLGTGGPISVPPGAKVLIASDGSVLSADPETPDAQPQLLGRIKLASPAGSAIAKALDGLFRVIGGGVLPQDESARVEVGKLESSNVKPTEVLIAMIEAQRMFDMQTKLIATTRDMDESSAQLMRLGS